jgi:hypothetical protein
MGKKASQWHAGGSKKLLVFFSGGLIKLVLCLNYLPRAIYYNCLLGLREISITWELAHSN